MPLYMFAFRSPSPSPSMRWQKHKYRCLPSLTISSPSSVYLLYISLLYIPPHNTLTAMPCWCPLSSEGGARGLVMANRLSEDISAPVLIIKGAVPSSEIPLVYNTSHMAWASDQQSTMTTSPQVYTGNRVLGGTTTINGMSYTRAEDVQINAWQTIGRWGETGRHCSLTTRRVGL